MTASANFISKEEATIRQPVELYDIYVGTTHYYHTNGDVAISFDGHEWTPATIHRESVKYNGDMKATEVNVTFAKTNPAISSYIASTPLKLTNIEIYKIFRDQSPYEKNLIFKGQIYAVSLKGSVAQAVCYGVEKLLEHQFNKWYYQIECNHTVFDDDCGLTEASYEVSVTISLDSSLTELTSATFGTYDDGYFNLGKVYFNGDYRQIVSHVESVITINYPFADLEDSDTVTITPGCDGNVETCVDKFNNISHFLGFPDIPFDNPFTWVNR